MWVHFSDRAISVPRLGIYTSTTADGPYTFVGFVDSAYGTHDFILYKDRNGNGRSYIIHNIQGTRTVEGVSYADNKAIIVERLALNCQSIDGTYTARMITQDPVNEQESSIVFDRLGTYFFITTYGNPYDASAASTIPRYKSAAAANFEAAISGIVADTFKYLLCQSDVGRTAITDAFAYPAAYPGNYANVQPDDFLELTDWKDGGGHNGFMMAGSWWKQVYLRDSRQIKWPVEFPTLTTMRVVVADAWDLPDYFAGPARPGAVSTSLITASGATIATAVPSSGTAPFTYRAERADDSSGVPDSFAGLGAFASGRSHLDSTAEAVTGYWYRYAVKDANDVVTYSDPVFVRTTAPVGDASADSTLTSIVFTLVGTNTGWTGTPFSLVGGDGAVLASQNVTNSTHATVTITTNGDTGPYAISDGDNEFVLSGVGGGTGTGINYIGLGGSVGI